MDETVNPQEAAPTPPTTTPSSSETMINQTPQLPQEPQTPSAKKSKTWIFLLTLMLLLFTAAAAGYYFLFYPKQQLNKARTLDQDIKTESSLIGNRTKIEEKGLNSKIVIEPSQNDVISGIVTIRAENTQENTKHVGFAISDNINYEGQGGPNLGFDSDPSAGWSKELDTSNYENGQYYIIIFAFENDTSSNPTGVTNVKVMIKN